MRDQGEPSYCRSAAVLLRDRRTDTCGRRAGIAMNMRKSACAARRRLSALVQASGAASARVSARVRPSRPPPGPRKEPPLQRMRASRLDGAARSRDPQAAESSSAGCARPPPASESLPCTLDARVFYLSEGPDPAAREP